MNRDIFYQGYQGYLDFVSRMDRGLFVALMRGVLLIGLPGLVCAILFQSLRRRVSVRLILPINWGVMLLGWFSIVGLPLQDVAFGRAEAGFVFLLSVAGLIFLPWASSYYLATRAGPRWIVAAVFYVVLGTLLIIQILMLQGKHHATSPDVSS